MPSFQTRVVGSELSYKPDVTVQINENQDPPQTLIDPTIEVISAESVTPMTH